MFGYRETGDITTKHKDVGSFHLEITVMKTGNTVPQEPYLF